MLDKIKSFNKPGVIIIEGHVQGLSNTRALGEAGIPVYVVDKIDCIARYSKYCAKFFRCPDFIQDEFAEFLIELANKESIRNWVLIPSNDHAVYTISKHKTRLELYYKVITPGINIIEKIYDKAKLIEIANQANVSVPATQLFKSEEESLNKELAYPVITKGRNGLSFYKAIGKKVLVAKDENELRKQFKFIRARYSIADTLTQELIPLEGNNHTVSFTTFCENGHIKAHWTGIKLREHPVRFGTATYAGNTYVEACHRHSEILLKKLKYTGVCEIEYILDPRDNQYKLIEVNPRTWLWVSLAKASGINYALMIYNHLNETKNLPCTPDTKTRYWINPITDTVFSILGVLKGKINPMDYLKSSMKRNTINAIFVKGDMKPGYLYLVNIFKFLHTR